MDAILGTSIKRKRLRDHGHEIGSGWLLSYRGASWVSHLIQAGTGSVHSHSAMTIVNGNDRLDVAEVREFKGGRRQPLVGHVLAQPGRIDVFRPNTGAFPQYDGDKAAHAMRDMTATRYGYGTALNIALRQVPLLWRLFPVDTSDVLPKGVASWDRAKIRPHCSMAVAIAAQRGGVDPVQWKPPYLVTPGDLTQSLLWRYWGTLT